MTVVQPKGMPFFCCPLAQICIMAGRTIEHSKDCPTKKEKPNDPPRTADAER